MIKKIVYLLGFLILSTLTVEAKVIKANFDVSYGIFGKIGTSKAVLTKNAKTYKIEIKLAATGLAKVLSGDRREKHISKGHIVNGLMVSDTYEVIKTHGQNRVSKKYVIDHKRKKVIKKYRKYKKGRLVSNEESTLDFYSKDDLLTLYFNLDTAIKNKTKPHTYVFRAVGAERQKGKVTVIIPKRGALAGYKEDLGNNASWYATAIIHQKIFSSKEGRLKIAVGSDGITTKAVLKDVIFFGDIRAVRTY